MTEEKIGKIRLDYRFYPGEDHYSDGQIEEEMLEIAEKYPREDYPQLIKEKESWPILYHFTHVRGNILDWLPMSGQERILEIGSGPGAITETLARMGKEVTCIDLSARRCRINAQRNKDLDNIRILVGNFQDIADNLQERFDLITLIGVFEYAQYSIQSRDPFADYLKVIRSLLAPGGRLVIAIENRLGLKYWAGATEDHTGLYFEGLEGYPTTNYVRTFSRPELEQLFARTGFSSYRFYYPYPDYKLPERIYSDDYLPGPGELNRNRQNFDRQRVELFSETRVYDTLLKDGLYPFYANSYFVILQEEAAACRQTAAGSGKILPNPVFSKYSNERAEVYRIRTDILRADTVRSFFTEKKEDNSQLQEEIIRDHALVVRKHPCGEKAAAHVASIYKKYQNLKEDLQETGLGVNACRIAGEDAYLEYLEGRNLEQQLDALLEQGEWSRLLETITGFFSCLEQNTVPFQRTEDFTHFFSLQEKLLEGKEKIWRSRRVSDLDLIFSNVILTADGPTLIDYEWTVSFPVPVSFLQYRCLYYYTLGNEKRCRLLQENSLDLFAQFGFTREDRQLYQKMEEAFQQLALGDYTPIWQLYPRISEGVVPMAPVIREIGEKKKKEQLEIYYDDGLGFRQELCKKWTPGENGQTRISIPVPPNCRGLRIDPCSQISLVRIYHLDQNGKPLSYHTNGSILPNKDLFFDTEDPQILITDLQPGQAVELQLETRACDGLQREALLSLYGKLTWMEGTKAWRLYKKWKQKITK